MLKGSFISHINTLVVPGGKWGWRWADYVAAGAAIVEGKNRITAVKCPMALRLSGLPLGRIKPRRHPASHVTPQSLRPRMGNIDHFSSVAPPSNIFPRRDRRRDGSLFQIAAGNDKNIRN